MKKLLYLYLNIGVKSKLEPSLLIRVRLLNIFNLAFMLISLVYAFINSSVTTIGMCINLFSVLVNLVIYYFTIRQKYITSFIILGLLNSFFAFCLALLFGKYKAAELLFCVGVVYSIAIFSRRWLIITGVIVNILLYLMSIYIYENYLPIFNSLSQKTHYFYYPNAFLFLMALFALAYLLKIENQQYAKQILQVNDHLSKANKKNEELILHILPHEIAEELRKTGDVEPRIYKNVSVMFTDFFEFTKTAENMPAINLVNDLDEYFTVFDRIIEKYDLEKLKTIGDAYMCVSGVPHEKEDHALEMIKAAIDIRDAVALMYTERIKKGKAAWNIRIGIHSGNVVAGVIGETKFAFDIWGDTVNTAARMESSSSPGNINISETTFELVKNQVQCAYRGKIQVKSKGEMNMYFVESLL
jgi:class 3 adenylate cyclase